MADFIPYERYAKIERDLRNYGGLVHLAPDRWAACVRHFDACGPGKFSDLGIESMTFAVPTEIEGVLYLPARYFPG